MWFRGRGSRSSRARLLVYVSHTSVLVLNNGRDVVGRLKSSCLGDWEGDVRMEGL